MFPGVEHGSIDAAMTAKTRLDLVASDDVGRFAATAFADPDRFDRKEIDLAAEALTMDQVAAAISEATGRPMASRALSYDDAVASGVSPGLAKSQQWASVEGYKVDVAEAMSNGVVLESFADWAKRKASNFMIKWRLVMDVLCHQPLDSSRLDKAELVPSRAVSRE